MDDRPKFWWWCKTHEVTEYTHNYGDEWIDYVCILAAELLGGPCDVVEAEEPKEKS